MPLRGLWRVAVLLGGGLLYSTSVAAQTVQAGPFHINVTTSSPTGDVALPLQILLLLTLLTFIPALLMAMTSFARILVVLSFLRQALGTQQIPPNQVLIALALFLTVFIMQPVGVQLHQQVVQPYLEQQITTQVALQQAIVPLRDFMLRHTREKDLHLFVQISRQAQPITPDDITLAALMPAFIISELKTAFQIGFLLYMPFLILDLVISSILLSMGMLMLPPVLISLPFKLMLFVLVDGWHLIVGSLVRSFQ
jgi:flagellar biosynthesis protein FliP